MQERIINYLVVILVILVSPGLLIDILQDENFNDRENLAMFVSATMMTAIYIGGFIYIIGFCI